MAPSVSFGDRIKFSSILSHVVALCTRSWRLHLVDKLIYLEHYYLDQ